MNLFSCEKCNAELLVYEDSEKSNEIINFDISCPCGYKNTHAFIGYPKLAGTENYYFEFKKETHIICKKR